MHRKRLRTRLLFAVIAASQALFPGLASIADARPDATSLTRWVAPHVEMFGAKHSWASHPEDCVLCQVVARQIAPTHTPPFELASVRQAPAPAVFTAPVPRAATWAVPNSRAPPVV